MFFATRKLTWWPEWGFGFYPVEAGNAPYDEAYFDRFEAQANSDIGRQLMEARVKFVDQYLPDQERLVDVGIGSGAFIKARGNDLFGQYKTYGFDVCPKAVDWLLNKRLFWNIYNNLTIPAASFWDVLEHLPNPTAALANVDQWCFVSIPLFKDMDHVLRSKHYRKDEHIWYFTLDGILRFMDLQGFCCKEYSNMETDIGREDIGTFAFKRIRR